MAAPLRLHESFGLNSQHQQLLWWDDFLGDVLDDRWGDGGAAGGSSAVIDAQTGGVVRITTDGDADDNEFIYWNNIRTIHVNKNVCAEFRLKPSSVSNIRVATFLYFGDNDNIKLDFDTDVDGNWHVETIDGGVPTNTDTGVAATTDYVILRIESIDTPSVGFYIDDALVATHTTNIPDDAADFLQPLILCQTRENATKSVDLDYIVIRQER